MEWRPRISKKRKKELIHESKGVVAVIEMTLLDLDYINKKPTPERLGRGLKILSELSRAIRDLQACWEDLVFQGPGTGEDLNV